ncbi:MAG: putative diguanylate cyclase AdrA [bacterium ADurb.Bin425]|nr:MAG: putative diguanylate cyclase AdrA [bacterium ADurb.Bin425]
MIDVDHFKQINDSHGHLAGDRVLAALGQLLKKRFRVEDIRGRWGGEEFIVAFRHIPRNTARGALQRALEELSKLEFKGDRDESFSISFSSGIVEYPAESKDLSDLLRRSDEKLYRAKEAGRNCIIA